MTIVDPSDLPSGGKPDKNTQGSTKAFNEDSSHFNPNKISIPFYGLRFGEQATVTISFMQNLECENGF